MLRRCTCFACPAVVLAVAAFVALPNHNVGQPPDNPRPPAEQAKKLYFTRLALKSAKARRRGKA